MKNVLKFADEFNADELFAVIESDHYENPILGQIKSKYENADIDDREFCQQVLDYLRPTPLLKKYAMILCVREDWDEPGFAVIEAEDEDDAYIKFETERGFDKGDLERLEEEGELTVIINEIK
jgi:hypothetical protein